MGDIGKGRQVTAYPSGLDTATSFADCAGNPCVGGDSMVAADQNNPNGAILAVEAALGTSPQGTAASVAARLAIMLAADGGIPRGTSFPGSPVNVPQLFYRTDLNVVYYFNTNSASWVQFLTSSSLSAYVPIASPVTITAQHTFNPSIAEAAFLLGANAQNQRVVGFVADTLWDVGGNIQRQASSAVLANAIPVTDASGTLNLWGSAAPVASRLSITDAAGTLFLFLVVQTPASDLTLLDGYSAYLGGNLNLTGTRNVFLQGSSILEVG